MKRPILVLGRMPKDGEPSTHLASGPWCFIDQETDFPDWEKRFIFAPEPLANRSLLPMAVKAAQTLAIKLVPAATQYLLKNSNSAEDPHLPLTYWQTLLLPWLINFSSQLVDRALRCDAMIKTWGKVNLKVPLAPGSWQFNFRDENDFTHRGAMGIQYNYWLCSRLLEFQWPKAWYKIQDVSEPDFAMQVPEHRSWSWLRELGKKILLYAWFPKIRGINLLQLISLNLAIWHPCKSPARELDLQTDFLFDKDLQEIINPAWSIEPLWCISMPQSLMALAHRPVEKCKKPRLRIASIIAEENARYRQKLAYWQASGNRIGHIQHGGNYGVVKTPCAAQLTEYAAQVFYTWGWSKQGYAKGNFEPMPSLLLCKRANTWGGNIAGNLIFVGTEMSAYGHRLDSQPTPMQFIAYRQAKAKFLEGLTPEITKAALYRPYFSIPGTLSDGAWIIRRFPHLGICKGELFPQLKRCRLLVLDHHGTTLLEAMAANIPIIAYWDKNSWPVTHQFNNLVSIMERAGIWHPAPEKAAAKAVEVWNDTGAWWNSREVQRARNIFCQNQINLSSDPVAVWREQLKIT